MGTLLKDPSTAQNVTNTNMETKALILLVLSVVALISPSQARIAQIPRSVIEASRSNAPKDPVSLFELNRMLFKRNADLLSDPRFRNCMKDAAGNGGNDAMAFMAKCISFVGRPRTRSPQRFGKRAKPLRAGKRNSDLNPLEEIDFSEPLFNSRYNYD